MAILEEFYEYLKTHNSDIEWYIEQIIDALEEGLIDDISTIKDHIEKNYGKNLSHYFMFKFKRALFRRESLNELKEDIREDETKMNVYNKSRREEHYDEYTGMLKHDEDCDVKVGRKI